MPKLTVSIEGQIVQTFELTQARTCVGRRPTNDIVLEHLSVSGEHAVLLLDHGRVSLQDLDSTNGSYVNGQPVRLQQLQPGDQIELGACCLSFEPPRVRVLSGVAAGREWPIVKAITTLGHAGVVAATIERQVHACVLSPVAGAESLKVNDCPVGLQATALRHGDLIELGGSRMQFLQP
jgi:hypothetical protein